MMNEFEIAQKLGASSYLLYRIIQTNYNITLREIQYESGMSEMGVYNNLKKLEETGVIEVIRSHYKRNNNQYKTTDNWRL